MLYLISLNFKMLPLLLDKGKHNSNIIIMVFFFLLIIIIIIIRDDAFVMEIAEPEIEKTLALYYFEEFCIQPMRLNLSFVRTEKMNDSGTPQ